MRGASLRDVGAEQVCGAIAAEGRERGAEEIEDVPLRIPLYQYRCDNSLPGDFPSKRVPQLVADPTSASRMYIVYHDVADEESADVNVYLRVLSGGGQSWDAGPRIKVNTNLEDPNEPSDQFMPSVTVDTSGRIHIIFCDDRKYEQADDQTNPPPKFDVFYAYSVDHGANWTNEELFADPEEPALDWNLSELDPHEYNGIAWYGDTVWTTFAGTSKDDVDPNDPNDPFAPAVIWSSKIEW